MTNKDDSTALGISKRAILDFNSALFYVFFAITNPLCTLQNCFHVTIDKISDYLLSTGYGKGYQYDAAIENDPEKNEYNTRFVTAIWHIAKKPFNSVDYRNKEEIRLYAINENHSYQKVKDSKNNIFTGNDNQEIANNYREYLEQKILFLKKHNPFLMLFEFMPFMAELLLTKAIECNNNIISKFSLYTNYYICNSITNLVGTLGYSFQYTLGAINIIPAVIGVLLGAVVALSVGGVGFAIESISDKISSKFCNNSAK